MTEEVTTEIEETSAAFKTRLVILLSTLSNLFVDAWLKALNGKLEPLENVMSDDEATWSSQ